MRVDGVDDGILYAPIERWADGDLLAGALAKQAVEYGAALASPVSVRELITDGSRVTSVATSDGLLSAGAVVVAGSSPSLPQEPAMSPNAKTSTNCRINRFISPPTELGRGYPAG